jgi:Ciliary BBSome complex subunit 1
MRRSTVLSLPLQLVFHGYFTFPAFQAFVDTHRSFPLKRQTVVTSIATLKKSHSDETSVSCLVLGTESSAIYILVPMLKTFCGRKLWLFVIS